MYTYKLHSKHLLKYLSFVFRICGVIQNIQGRLNFLKKKCIRVKDTLPIMPLKISLLISSTLISWSLLISEAVLEVFFLDSLWLLQCPESIQKRLQQCVANQNIIVCLHIPYLLDEAWRNFWIFPRV